MKQFLWTLCLLALVASKAQADVVFVEVEVDVGLSNLTKLTTDLDLLGPRLTGSFGTSSNWASSRTFRSRTRSALLRNRAAMNPSVTGQGEDYSTANPLLQTSGDAGFAAEGFGGGADYSQGRFGPAIEGALIEMSEEELMATLAEVPDGALKVADVLISFSDRSIAFLAGLRGLLAGRKMDWTKIMEGGRSLTAAKARNLDSMGQNTRATETEEEAREAAFRRAVRSILKILLGVFIGLSLWFVIRSM